MRHRIYELEHLGITLEITVWHRVCLINQVFLTSHDFYRRFILLGRIRKNLFYSLFSILGLLGMKKKDAILVVDDENGVRSRLTWS